MRNGPHFIHPFFIASVRTGSSLLVHWAHRCECLQPRGRRLFSSRPHRHSGLSLSVLRRGPSGCGVCISLTACEALCVSSHGGASGALGFWASAAPAPAGPSPLAQPQPPAHSPLGLPEPKSDTADWVSALYLRFMGSRCSRLCGTRCAEPPSVRPEGDFPRGRRAAGGGLS